MSKEATEFQRKSMSRMYRGTQIFKPTNTGWIDDHVASVREWVANIFFYRKGDATIMIDAGYNYDRLAEKMAWLGIAPEKDRMAAVDVALGSPRGVTPFALIAVGHPEHKPEPKGPTRYDETRVHWI